MQEYTLESISTGTAHSFEVIVTAKMMDDFKVMTGDINPLHTEIDVARGHGHADRVVYGMLTASFYSTLVGVYLPGRYGQLRQVDVSFRNPVYPGDRLIVRGEVVAVCEAARQIEIKAEVVKVDGTRVSKAKISAGIRVA
jgi:3-hydroxybutyryl-CoA dehydratase